MGSESIEEFDVLEDCQEKQLTPNAGADEVLFVVVVGGGIEVASVIELSEASGRVAAGLFMTEG